MRPFLIALQFLTRIPIRLEGLPANEDVGRSLLWYPVVGLLIGGVLWASSTLLASSTPLLRAAVLLAIWVSITGALHIDGLADCADAWIGGRGDRERMLNIMKDPYAGPVAVAVVVIVLLLKFSALDAIVGRGTSSLVMLAPVLARGALPALFLTTPYVRAEGLGSVLAAYLPRVETRVVLTVLALVLIAAFRLQGLIALAAATILFVLLRFRFIALLDGFTGDCAGAMTELIETGVLLSLALAPGMAAQ